MDTILSASFLTALFASGVRQSIPLIYGSVGDAVSERAGVMGISLEGEMLFGAFFSYLVALPTGSLWWQCGPCGSARTSPSLASCSTFWPWALPTSSTA